MKDKVGFSIKLIFLIILIGLFSLFIRIVHGQTQPHPSVQLNWTGPDSGMTYNVYRGTITGNESSTSLNSSPITTTSYLDLNVSATNNYCYIVKGTLNGQTTATNEACTIVPLGSINLTIKGN